ncbi:MAG: hypothetical protein MZV70_29220 [Desulfobacterales bacterium]|nr:hypothetical protein [Desulfobacterales bacterium]
MTYSEFDELLNTYHDTCEKLLCRKGHDYANDRDAFVNFETSANVAGIKPEQSCLVLIGTKLSRIRELIGSGKAPNHESLEDSVVDLGCYVALLYGILHDRKCGYTPPKSVNPNTLKVQ